MNAKEAKSKVESGAEYKYVCQLVPAFFAMANIKTKKSHGTIGYECGLVAIDFESTNPFKIKQPKNFKAGRLKITPDGTVKQTGFSSDFSKAENAFLDEEQLQAFFETADIKILG